MQPTMCLLVILAVLGLVSSAAAATIRLALPSAYTDGTSKTPTDNWGARVYLDIVSHAGATSPPGNTAAPYTQMITLAPGAPLAATFVGLREDTMYYVTASVYSSAYNTLGPFYPEQSFRTPKLPPPPDKKYVAIATLCVEAKAFVTPAGGGQPQEVTIEMTSAPCPPLPAPTTATEQRGPMVGPRTLRSEPK